MSFYNKERTHINLAILISIGLIVFFSFMIVLILEEQFGYFFLFIPIIFIAFSAMKLIKSVFLLINLEKLSTNFREDRMNIYIYENWHKKFVANFWVWVIFLFIYFYGVVIYTFLYFLNVTSFADLEYWIYIVITTVFVFASSIFYKINSKILAKNIAIGKNQFENIEDKINELKLISISVKNDYKFAMFFVISFFTIFPFLLWFSPKFRTFYKKI